MGLIELYRSRNYFKRIFYTTILLIVPLLLIFCSVLYAFSRNTALELQQHANNKVLSQINYNIDNLNEMVTNLTVSTFNDRDIISLLNNPSLDMFQFYNKLEKMDRILISNPYLSSIAIYNGSNKCYYSTTFQSPISCGAKETNNILKAFLAENRTFPKLTLLPMTEEDGAGKGSVLSLLIYNSAGDYKPDQSVLMLNVKSSWMFDNIRMINELADTGAGYAFIVDSQGKPFSPREQAAPDDSIMEELNGRLLNVQAPSGNFIVKTAQGKQIVNYLTSKVNGWKIVSVQPYDAVFGKINALGTFSLAVLLLFVVLSLLVAAFASMKLYKPVGRLMNQLNLPSTPDRERMSGSRDELGYLSYVYEDMQTTMSMLRHDREANRDVRRHYFLQRWLLDSRGISESEYEEYCRERSLDAGSTFVLCLLKIDDYAKFRASRNEREQKLVKFAATNIMKEIIASHDADPEVEMKSDHLVLLLRHPQGVDEPASGLIDRLKLIQDTVNGYYQLTLTVVAGRPFNDYRQLTEQYDRLQFYSLHRMILGKQALITPDLYGMEAAEANEPIPLDLERRLAESIRSNDLTAMKGRLDDWIIWVKGLHIEHIDFAVLQIVVVIHQTVRELNIQHVQTVMSKMKRYTNQILEQETLEDIRSQIEHVLEELVNERNDVKTDKQSFLVDAVKEIVQLNYTDPNLSLQGIAAIMKMSSAYLGRHFRSSESLSVADYINQVRLAVAMQLLEQGDDSVIEIMHKVGYSSESNFFKLFKKNIGMTPGEYRLARKG